MKATFTLLGMLTFGNLFSQINSSQLDHNNVSVHISDVGTYFLDYVNSTKGYEIPKGSGKFSIYSTQFWFAGKDSSNEIRFIQGGIPNYSDVFNGPISNPGTYSSASYQSDWGNSIWEMCQSDIDTYKTWWQACIAGNPNFEDCQNVTQPSIETMNRILSWPAHGNVGMGQSYYLAPYYDYNQDGAYNPEDGDYPIIKGCCATYMIQNDAAETHTLTNTDSLGFELHFMFYQYQTGGYLNDVTFVDIKAVNRSNNNYSDFVSSISVDADLGYYGDDYYGCDSSRNTMYFYNGDNLDEDDAGLLGYGVNPPALGIVGLDADLSSCAPIYSGSTIIEKWNIMNGLQPNGSSWLTPISIPTKYVYSGNPTIAGEWSAQNDGVPSGDVRGIASFYHGTLNSGDTLTQTLAITFAQNGNNLENVTNILNISDEIKMFYDNESDVPCNGATWGIEDNELIQFSISPNPANSKISISSSAPIKEIILLDILGNRILSATSTSIDVSKLSNGVYFIYLETQNGQLLTQEFIKN